MRSSIIIASTLLAGALARPHVYGHEREHKQGAATNVEYEVVTVIVTVTAGAEEPTSTSSALSVTVTSSPQPEPKHSFEAAPAPSPSAQASFKSDGYYGRPITTSLPLPEFTPASSSTPEPTSSPKAKPSLESKPKPEPKPEPKPSSSSIARVSSSVAPASSSTSSTPQPSSPANDHVSGREAAYLSSGPDYEAAMLFHHNDARANHDAAPLVWDKDCEATARIAAERCIFEHYIPKDVFQGQNLFAVSGKAYNATAGVRENWYNGELPKMIPYFGQNDIPDDIFHEVGHLTQMVWKETTKVGCVSIDCGDKMIVNNTISTINKYTVCNYAPAGNVYGGYAKNVEAPFTTTNLGSWSD